MISLLLFAIETPEQLNKFLQMYHKYKGIVYYIALKILKNKELAEDVSQEVFLHIFQHFDEFIEYTCHKTWGYVVVISRNASFDKLKAEKKHEHDPDDILEINDFSNETIEDEVIRNLEMDKLLEAFSKVDKYCNIILLKYYCGYSDEMLAEHYNISTAAVRKRIERCKVKLRQHIEKDMMR